jgi:mevalonate kinase
VAVNEPRSVVCSAPARANLIGNPSDQYGGCTLACSVPLRARVELRAAEGTRLATEGEEIRIEKEADLALCGDLFDVARAVLASLPGPLPEARIAYASEVPLGSGLAGSSALVVALLRALLAWRGDEAGPPQLLAERAREIERCGLGVTCGYVDQYLAVFGGCRYVDFRGKTPEGSFASEPFASVESVEGPLPFVLAFTGRRHSSDSVHRPIRARWLAGEIGVRAAMERMAEIGLAGRRALQEGDFAELGRLMNENHALVRDLGGSGDANEELIAASLSAGAPGAKLAGAGDGGTIVALWPFEDAAPLEAELRRAGAKALYRPSREPGVRLEAAAERSGL